MPSVIKSITNHREVLFIILLCIISRLPQILGGNFIVDGDEAVYGLMVKHFIDGTELPLYFYGQSYGFVGFELLVSSLFYLLFGMSDLSLKLSMFLLWIVAIVMHYFIFKLITKEKRIALGITVIMILSSSWALWSLKARGGYPTSFMLSSILLYLLLNDKVNKNIGFWTLSGLILALIAETQALWLAGLFPFLVYAAFKKGKFAHSLVSFVPFAICSLIFYYLKKDLHAVWKPQFFSLEWVGDNLYNLPGIIYLHFNGSFVTSELRPTNWATTSFAYIATTLLVVIIFLNLLQFILKKKGRSPIGLLATFSVLFILTYILFINGRAPRYALPLTGFLLVAASPLILMLSLRVRLALFIPLAVIGSFALISFKDFKINGVLPTSEKKELITMIDYLEENDVRYFFCPASLLKFQVMFYTQERMIGRSTGLEDRYPPYIDRCNQYLEKHPNGEHLAYVHYYGFVSEENRKKALKIGERYGVILNPIRDFIIKEGFEFPEPENTLH